ncbi:MAG: hypothetical protein DSZ28_04310 [Thiothrix sp.]|nr:MAG: hypothetical protein DSZ28_04310 [Thiothrix sp.]
MPWIKKGLIYCPEGQHEWNQSHAQVPVVDAVDKNTLRIWFATRDSQGRSRTSYIDVSAQDPTKILYTHEHPILPLGKPGTFDDCGVMPSWIVNQKGKKYLYYIGWTVRNTIPYHNSIGLAVSTDGGQSFSKYAEGPIFSPTPTEPYFTGTSCVLIDKGVWKNWYLSCTQWKKHSGKYEPYYHIKYAESDDGIHWRREGRVAIDYKTADEGGIVKSSVIIEDNLYKMWYAYRKGNHYRQDKSRSYRIGYAESTNGVEWQRMDKQVKLGLSTSGWDSEMLAYPHVIDHGGQRYLFYNGNGFGQSGFGYAQWENEDTDSDGLKT